MIEGRLLSTVLVLMLAGVSAGPAQTEVAKDSDSADAEVTVINSDKLTFDYEQQYAKFEDNVVVVDPTMTLKADILTVRFNEKSEAKSIVAVGHVRIEQEDKTATSGKATYDVDSGMIVLTEDPKVWRGQDTLTGDKITFWRDQNKMVCEPRARLVLFPQSGGSRAKLFGE
ncbi:MAG: hypothetical protein KJ626_16275 [Verrucomicrobia bacterium]|nr:hypothetical protein [Verrucomicrobiota bacterium]